MTDTRTWWTIGEMKYDATGQPDAANDRALAAVDVPAPFKSPFKCPFCGETYEYGDPNHSHN